MTNNIYTSVIGTGGISSSPIDWSTLTVTSGATGIGYDNSLKVLGNAEISGSLSVGGKDIAESLERIEERLAILRPNEELEQKWENLRGLRKAYMELEKEILEKEKVWAILKK